MATTKIIFIIATTSFSVLFIINDIAFRLWKRYIRNKYIGWFKHLIWSHRQWELERELKLLKWYNWLWEMKYVLNKIRYWSIY